MVSRYLRYSFSVATMSIVCILAFLLLQGVACANELPNIIFAMADDLGWGDVQYNGGNAFTPNLDRMAESPNTIRMDRCYSGGPRCSPTRGTVLTGRNHNRYCIWSTTSGNNQPDFIRGEPYALPLTEITVAEVLRDHGYSTALFGKWHLGDFKPTAGGNKKWPVSHPGLHGFDQWWATGRSARTHDTNCGCFNTSCSFGHYSRMRQVPCTNYYTNVSDDIIGWPHPIEGDDSAFLWTITEKYIREQVNLKKPFFLYLPFHTAHIRYIATEHYRSLYLSKGYTPDQADYYGTVTAMDHVMGQLRDLLDKLGIKNNTMLWFTSDNGPARKTPGSTNGLRGRKSTLYEGGVRVPGLIEWPNVIKNNRRSQFPVVSNDLLLTVYDLLGISPYDNRSLDGISILPFLHGNMETRNRTISWASVIQNGDFSGRYRITMADDRYKIMAAYKNNRIRSYVLYDLLNDIGETQDVAKQHSNVTQSFLSQIEEWRVSVMNSVENVGCLNST